jgi:hypothetical protein
MHAYVHTFLGSLCAWPQPNIKSGGFKQYVTSYICTTRSLDAWTTFNILVEWWFAGIKPATVGAPTNQPDPFVEVLQRILDWVGEAFTM